MKLIRVGRRVTSNNNVYHNIALFPLPERPVTYVPLINPTQHLTLCLLHSLSF